MSLEVKLGGLDMVFGLGNKRNKSKDEGPRDPSRREFLKGAAKKSAAVAGGAIALQTLPYLKAMGFGPKNTHASGFVGKYDDIPDAIEADPEPKMVDIWWDMKNERYFEHPYSCTNIEMVKRIMRINHGISYNGEVKAITPKISHAYQLIAAKLGEGMTKVEDDNHSLINFTGGLYNFYKNRYKVANPDYYAAAQDFAEGMFMAAMYDKPKGEAVKKASEFMKKDVRGKELMLREVHSNYFEKFSANPQVTDIYTVQYKMLSFYWNLGLCLISHRGFNQNETYVTLTRDDTYQKLSKKFGFDTASVSLV